MIRFHLLAWDVVSEPKRLEQVSALGEAYFSERMASQSKSFVVLSTCHRLEIYSSSEITGFEDLGPYHELKSQEAIRHLFRVASGVESVSIGEQEILRQVKDAFENALENEVASKEFSVIFRIAISVGKEARDRTGISKGRTSIPSLVGQMLSTRFHSEGKRVAIVGTGKIAKDMVKYASESRPSRITVYGRNKTMLSVISDQFSVNTVQGIDPEAISSENDFVIVATSSSSPLFESRIVDGAKSTFIDLCMPPNVARSAFDSRVVSLADLEPVIRANSKDKESRIPEVEKIIDEGVYSLSRKLAEFEAEELIKTIFNHAKNVETDEISDAIAALRHGVSIEEVLKRMSDSLINRVLAPQTLAIKRLVKSEDGSELRQAINTFYNVLKDSQEKATRQTSSSRRASRNPQGQIPR